MTEPLRVLIAEDNENDAILLLRQLKKDGFDPEYEIVQDAITMGRLLDEREWDVVLSDFTMPQFTAPDALELLKERKLDLPFIVISGTVGEEIAVRTMRAGAHDYLMKGHLKRLGEAIRRECHSAQSRRSRRETERKLSERERLLTSLTTNMSDMVSLTDLHGRCTYASPSHRQLGYEPEDIIGHPIERKVHEDDRQSVIDGLSTLFKRPDGVKAVFRYERADGSYCWLESVGRVLCDDKGEPAELIFCSRDITDRRELEAQLSQSDRLSCMGMLAAGVAHEINNPLAYVLYNLECLTEDFSELIEQIRLARTALERLGVTNQRIRELEATLNPTNLDDFLERFNEALSGTHRIRDISKGLGTFSRVEKDQLTPVSLKQVIEAAINMAYNEVKYRARLVKDYGRIPTVLASEGRMAQVFLNLIINATHAIDEGDVENNEIRIKTWSEDGNVFAQVSDTGSGIRPENLTMLFDPFFTTKKVGVGSGLGLPISKSIIEGYNGDIIVESELGVGTSFTIRLPVNSEKQKPEKLEMKVDAKHKVNGRVLVVDDEDGIRLAVARMLREHETVQAANGSEAKSLIKADQNFDLILCDMMMSDISGMDLHSWLAQSYPLLADRFIFMTGGAFTPRAREYLSQIENLRLEKPFDVVNFKKIVNERIAIAKLEQN